MARRISDPHWRDSARQARFFVVDYRAAFPLLLFLLHIRWWTFITAIVVMLFLGALEKYGFTINNFFRWVRSLLAGPHRTATPWWKE